MPLTLADHFALIEDEFAAAVAAPLSVRKAFLVAVLLDHFADRVFERFRTGDPKKVFGAEDLPAYRDLLRGRSPALATIFALCAQKPGGPELKTLAVEVPIADYPSLSVEDFMVSLYNQHTVQRVMIIGADGSQTLIHEILAAAIAWWRAAAPWRPNT